MIEAMGRKIIALNDVTPYEISWKSTNQMKSY
jgi:hypothetical protein